MRSRDKAAKIVFYGLAAIMVLTTIFCFASALSWINRPFAGILLNEYPLVGSMGNREWPGMSCTRSESALATGPRRTPQHTITRFGTCQRSADLRGFGYPHERSP